MKIGRYQTAGRVFYGELDGDVVHPLVGDIGALSRDKQALPLPLASLRTLAPVAPTKIIAIGPGHNNMMAGRQPPARPFLFFKPSTSVANPGDAIRYPMGVENILYEMELAIVIGKTATRVSQDEALDHVLGYTCCNDVTAGKLERDWGTQFSYHWKAFDTFAPLGPVVATDLHEIEGLRMTSRINGSVHADTQVSLIYSPADLVSWISHIMTLNPGDIIATGAAAQADLAPGDICEIEIDGIGKLVNPVVAAQADEQRAAIASNQVT